MSFLLRLASRKELITNACIGGALGFIGDVVCQTVVEGKPVKDIDNKRLLAMSVFGTMYSGGVSTLVYNSYKYMLPRTLSATPFKFGISCSLVDNFVHVPVLYTPAFFVITGLVQGESPPKVMQNLNEGYMESISCCWKMWVPLQLFNFAVLPFHLRVPFMNLGCVFWNIWIDSIGQNAKLEADQQNRNTLLNVQRMTRGSNGLTIDKNSSKAASVTKKVAAMNV